MDISANEKALQDTDPDTCEAEGGNVYCCVFRAFETVRFASPRTKTRLSSSLTDLIMLMYTFSNRESGTVSSALPNPSKFYSDSEVVHLLIVPVSTRPYCFSS